MIKSIQVYDPETIKEAMAGTPDLTVTIKHDTIFYIEGGGIWMRHHGGGLTRIGFVSQGPILPPPPTTLEQS